MERYIHLFDTTQEMEQARSYNSEEYHEPWLAVAKDSDQVTYNLPPMIF